MTTPTYAEHELDTARVALRQVLEDYLLTYRREKTHPRVGAHLLSRAIVVGIEQGEWASARIVGDITAALREELGA